MQIRIQVPEKLMSSEHICICGQGRSSFPDTIFSSPEWSQGSREVPWHLAKPSSLTQLISHPLPITNPRTWLLTALQQGHLTHLQLLHHALYEEGPQLHPLQALLG